MVLALELVDAIFAETGKIAFGRGSARRGKFRRRATFYRFTHRIPVELARSVTNLAKIKLSNNIDNLFKNEDNVKIHH